MSNTSVLMSVVSKAAPPWSSNRRVLRGPRNFGRETRYGHQARGHQVIPERVTLKRCEPTGARDSDTFPCSAKDRRSASRIRAGAAANPSPADSRSGLADRIASQVIARAAMPSDGASATSWGYQLNGCTEVLYLDFGRLRPLKMPQRLFVGADPVQIATQQGARQIYSGKVSWAPPNLGF